MLLNHLFGKKAGKYLFSIDFLSSELNTSKKVLVQKLKELEKKGLVHLTGKNESFVRKNMNFVRENQELIDIYNLIEGVPEFEAEFIYRNKLNIRITTPFKSSNLEKIRLVVKKEKRIYIEPDSFWFLFFGLNQLSETYIQEIRWRFHIDIGYEIKRDFKVWYFKKCTIPESFIFDLYSILNAVLLVEGYLSKYFYKPITKEELIESIKELVEEDIEGLEEKKEEELWKLLEEEAKMRIPQIDGYVNSMAHSHYADALLLLARKGKFYLIKKSGKLITGKWREE